MRESGEEFGAIVGLWFWLCFLFPWHAALFTWILGAVFALALVGHIFSEGGES